MEKTRDIPVFSLFGETTPFPDVVHCERFRDRAPLHDWHIGAHRHGQMAQVFIMHRGEAMIRIDEETSLLGDGRFHYVAPQVVHALTIAGGSDGHVISIPAFVLSGIASSSAELGERLARPFCGAADPATLGILGELTECFRAARPYRNTVLVGLTQAFLAAIAAGQADAPDPAASGYERQRRRLDALMAEHLGDRWRPKDYARALSITTGHLSRICRETVGQSATDYIENAVLAEACRLLAFTREPVAEIGYRLGYRDPSYFSRRFRVLKGVTPSDYRERFSTAAD
ncbi:helix-turn-helix domain-containing protein [Martelella lutilitoris]|uniref:Helix-turn-helix domain-containing protein n=1 Tax=Martelella lutilitoris TaxID=2583532 RepID=A0A7T7KL10_9HYPH|nr:helix-turn-helix domain-containing protein [Martelella lutilitoris]QQM30078.1 helix-turn-helix domain-containing protein [Martelella lutilitoris]